MKRRKFPSLTLTQNRVPAHKYAPLLRCFGNWEEAYFDDRSHQINQRDKRLYTIAEMRAETSKRPNAGAGIVPANLGIIVIDIDENAAEPLAGAPLNQCVRTPGGGLHIWAAAPYLDRKLDLDAALAAEIGTPEVKHCAAVPLPGVKRDDEKRQGVYHCLDEKIGEDPRLFLEQKFLRVPTADAIIAKAMRQKELNLQSAKAASADRATAARTGDIKSYLAKCPPEQLSPPPGQRYAQFQKLAGKLCGKFTADDVYREMRGLALAVGYTDFDEKFKDHIYRLAAKAPPPPPPKDKEAEVAKKEAKRASINFEFADEEIARDFIPQVAEKFRYNWDTKEWRHCENGIWIHSNKKDGGQVQLEFGEYVRRKIQELDGVDDKKAAARKRQWVAFLDEPRQTRIIRRMEKPLNLKRGGESPLPTVQDDFDTNPAHFAFKNGLLDLENKKFRAIKPADMISRQSKANYDPRRDWREAPAVIKLMEILAGGEADEARVRWILKLLASSFYGAPSDPKFIVLIGRGSNGKSCVANILRDVLGNYANTSDFSIFLSSNNNNPDSPNSILAQCVGRRLVVASEGKKGAQFDEAIIKRLLGGEDVSSRAQYGKRFSFRPTFNILITTNNLPKSNDTSLGFWRRIVIVPFTGYFKPSDEVNNIFSQGRDDLAACLLEHYWLFKKEGIAEDMPEDIKKAIDEYKSQSDHVGQWMSDRCDVGDGREGFAEAYKDFSGWYQAERGEKVMSKIAFGKEIRGHRHLSVERGQFGLEIRGLKIKPGGSDYVGED